MVGMVANDYRNLVGSKNYIYLKKFNLKHSDSLSLHHSKRYFYVSVSFVGVTINSIPIYLR